MMFFKKSNSPEPEDAKLSPLDTRLLDEAKGELFAQIESTSVTFGAGTHPGKVRARNEDHYLLVRRRRSREVLLSNLPAPSPHRSDEDAYVYVVADGIGGGTSGDRASRLALQAGWDLGGDEINWSFRATPKGVEEVLRKIKLYPLLIHKALIRETKNRPELRGMGTTFTGAYTIGPDAFITHVGDSRALLIREGKVHQITTDQTLAEYYSRQSDSTHSPEEIERLSHVLVSCLGAVDDNVDVETQHFKLLDGDALLLCSDGLTDMVDNERIAATITSNPNPQTAVDQLIEQALAAGGRDNVTVVVGYYSIREEETTQLIPGTDTAIDPHAS